MSKRYDIVALGEPMIEFNAVEPAARKYLQGFGGDTANFAIAAARLGARTAYLTRLGGDAFGDAFMALWAEEGVDCSQVERDPLTHTAVYFVTHGERGHAFSYLRAGSAASRMNPAWLPQQTVREARLLHFSGITQAISPSACDTAFRAVEVAREAGTLVAYDPNLRLNLWPLPRARAIIRETAAACDYFLPSFDDVKILAGSEEAQAVFDWCLGLGARQVALKIGPQGVIVGDAQGRAHVPGFKVQAVDATGAGDCFDGAFLTRILAGDAMPDAARYANAAAALATTGFGAIAPLPRAAQVEAFLAQQ